MINASDKLFLERLGENVRKYRLKNNLSQSQLAFEIGTTLRQIQRMEAGTANASIVFYKRISEIFEIDINKLITVF